jgi:hypothetical protein
MYQPIFLKRKKIDYYDTYRTVHLPRFVAKTTMGASEDSKALFRNVKHSMSSM